MNLFNDNRFVHTFFLFIWIMILMVLIFQTLSPKSLPELPVPSLKGKIKNPSPEGLKELFNENYYSSIAPAILSNNPFYYPVPPPPPEPPAPETPPPVSKQYKLHYKGFFTSTHGDKLIYLSVDDVSGLKSVGNLIIEDLYLIAITPTHITLKTGENSLSELNIDVLFDQPITADIPLKK